MNSFLLAGLLALPALQVSENGRFLVTKDGQPFFWLGDTCWRMVENASKTDAPDQPAVERYFANRAAKGFTVIQTRITGASNRPNAHGHAPFIEGDFGSPRVVEGPDNDFWDMVDHILDRGEAHGLYFALLPVWANDVSNDHQWVRQPVSAYRYGRFLGARYANRTHILWILGGDMFSPDRGVEQPARLVMIRAMAEGIADGITGEDAYDGRADWSQTLMSFHPPGGNRSSSQFLHNEPWLDFNMIQTTTRFHFASYENVQRDYARLPVKPALESEAAYEESFSLKAAERKTLREARIQPWDVRRAAYWTVFSGGFGFTYGNRNFISWLRKGETSANGAYRPWYESLDTPGAFQMRHLRQLMESRPMLTRVPADETLVGSAEEAPDRCVAARDRSGAYLMVYTPTGRIPPVLMSAVSGPMVRAWWFDPRTGGAKLIGEYPPASTRAFEAPGKGPENDWVLVLDDASQGFGPPGQPSAIR